MGDIFPFRRSAWKPAPWRSANWRHERGRIGRRTRKARRLISFSSSRYYGFAALAALAGAALLLQNGYLPSSSGSDERGTGRYPEFIDHNRAPRQNATAIDGDSLRMGNQEIRLVGIDAPELFQTCRDEHGREWTCGCEAHARLLALLSRDTVNCVSSSKDRYGRILATCSAGRVTDVGEAMVRAGYAVNFMSGRYQAAEAEARAEKRGIWRGSFERPQEWRRRNPRSG